MVIGILSDAHGNIFGLASCLLKLEELKVRKIFFLGDALGYFNKHNEVLELLRSKKITCLKGNHEAMALGQIPVASKKAAVYNTRFIQRTLTLANKKFIAQWPEKRTIRTANARILMVHGSPFELLEGYIYPDTGISRFLNLKQNVFFIAHTHIPFIRKLKDKLIINVGSSGMPRDDGRFISCCLFDTKNLHARILRLPFYSGWINSLVPFHSSIRRVLRRRKGESSR